MHRRSQCPPLETRPMRSPERTCSPATSLEVTGSSVNRATGVRIAITERPATLPTKATSPLSGAITAWPGRATRSTPLCAASQSCAAGLNSRMTLTGSTGGIGVNMYPLQRPVALPERTSAGSVDNRRGLSTRPPGRLGTSRLAAKFAHRSVGRKAHPCHGPVPAGKPCKTVSGC